MTFDTIFRATGAEPSTIDIRDFAYVPDKASLSPIKGGQRYAPGDIDDQHRVGICTAISLTMNAQRALGMKFSADFQYLLQKKFYDKNWNEGSSARAALHTAYTYGFLPEVEWTHTTEKDRELPYSRYVEKLKAIPDAEVQRLLAVASQYKRLSGYAAVPIDRDKLASAIDESKAGLIVRFVIDNQWYRRPIEPLRKPVKPISGHLINYTNYDGNSFRVANSWGVDWCDDGTAYGSLLTYTPTEAWLPYYLELPKHIETQKEKLLTLQGELLSLLQKVIALFNLKK